MSSIGRSFERDSSSIHPLISRTGGIRPPERKRSRLALTLPEREEISRDLKIGMSLQTGQSTIGPELAINPSSVTGVGSGHKWQTEPYVRFVP